MPTTISKIIERFDKEFDNLTCISGDTGDLDLFFPREQIKSFITSAVEEAFKDTEVEMKEVYPNMDIFDGGYNTALDDIKYKQVKYLENI